MRQYKGRYLREKCTFCFKFVYYSFWGLYLASPEFVKRKFLSKSFSTQNDTLLFEVLDSIYNLTSGHIWQLTVKNSIIKYIHLDSFPTPFDQLYAMQSYFLSDSISIDSCGVTFNQLNFTNAPDSVRILDREYYYEVCLNGLGSNY